MELGTIKTVQTVGAVGAGIAALQPGATVEWLLQSASGIHDSAAPKDLWWSIIGASTLKGKKTTVPVGDSLSFSDSFSGQSLSSAVLTSTNYIAINSAAVGGEKNTATALVIERPRNSSFLIAEWQLLHPGEPMPPGLFEEMATLAGYTSALTAAEWEALHPGVTMPTSPMLLIADKLKQSSRLRLI